MASFKELDIFKISVNYVKQIYQTTESFPTKETYGLVSQLRRSAVSVPSNIAEGTSRRTAKDKRRFIDIALGSLSESHAQLILSNALKYVDNTRLESLEKTIDELRPRLIAFYRSIQTRPYLPQTQNT